jgi:hypothetical protein
VSFIRIPERDIDNAAARSRTRQLKPDHSVAWVELRDQLASRSAPMTSAAIPVMTTGGRKMSIAFAAIKLAAAIGIDVLALAIQDREH